ncbi:MAG: toxic anion resistance protein, partial [Oscillospiraceae bacterium]|nr:toxic anion resistance protein [Oscillospiraceae bacterium]
MAEEYIPALTLAPESAPTVGALKTEPSEAELLAKRDETAVKLDISQLSEAERKIVTEFSEKIDITDTNAILTYGSASQRNIADFSANTLNSVKTKDMGEVGDMLSSLVVQLKGFNYGEQEKRGLFGL